MNSKPLKTTPTQPSDRLIAIDVLRGFALLGILVVNIQSFGLVGVKYQNPMALGDLEGISYWTWWVTYLFFDSKCMTIFSVLFGAGIILMTDRFEQKSQRFTGLHYRRTFWLMLFGLAHAHLLWFGDILFLYGLCGMVVFWARKWQPRWLIVSGLTLLMVGSAISLLVGATIPFWDEAELNQQLLEWNPPPSSLQPELDAYRGNWLEQTKIRSKTAIFMETFLVGFWGFWRAGGLMLIGMALFKLDIISGRRHSKFYLGAGLMTLLIGLAIVQFGINRYEHFDWSYEYSFFLGNQFNYWGSLIVSFGYVCLVMLACKTTHLRWLKSSLAAVGQMALTNYLMQTIICTTLFYGHGLGWYGHLSRIQLAGIVLAICILQMIVSPIWLRHFRFGPFEWLWRSLSYWKRQPLKRSKA